FLTSAGGGAGLYKSKARDYVAREKSAHHFTLFDFDGDRVTLTPIDITGKEIDRYVLTKQPTPPEEFCSYEVEELRRFLRLAVASAPPVRLAEGAVSAVDTFWTVPTRFAVPVAGRLVWGAAPGWKVRRADIPFHLQPGQALRIPLQAEVAAGPF